MEDRRGAAIALVALATIAQHQRRPEQALHRAGPALAAAERIGEADIVGNISGHQCVVLIDPGRLDEAGVVAYRGLDLATRNELPFRRVEMMLYPAEVVRLQVQLADAVALLQATEPAVELRPPHRQTV